MFFADDAIVERRQGPQSRHAAAGHASVVALRPDLCGTRRGDGVGLSDFRTGPDQLALQRLDAEYRVIPEPIAALGRVEDLVLHRKRVVGRVRTHHNLPGPRLFRRRRGGVLEVADEDLPRRLEVDGPAAPLREDRYFWFSQDRRIGLETIVLLQDAQRELLQLWGLVGHDHSVRPDLIPQIHGVERVDGRLRLRVAQRRRDLRAAAVGHGLELLEVPHDSFLPARIDVARDHGARPHQCVHKEQCGEERVLGGTASQEQFALRQQSRATRLRREREGLLQFI
mmetsp:Transcript_8485/g.26522  ORF Transcript_8485/g.26522 Transcript_8485/m.26522 type:complete len:283 (+) Transcript_8485:360-1208(+)